MSTETLAEALAKPRKVAVYMSLSIPGWFSLMEVNYVAYDEHFDSLPEGQVRESPYETYVRVTEPFDIPTLKAISRDEVTRGAIEALNEQERKAYKDLEAKLAAIRDQKQQLLALTHQPSEPQAGEERTSAT